MTGHAVAPNPPAPGSGRSLRRFAPSLRDAHAEKILRGLRLAGVARYPGDSAPGAQIRHPDFIGRRAPGVSRQSHPATMLRKIWHGGRARQGR